MKKEKKIILLGSTGSIGINTLDVVRDNPDRFKIIALAAKRNWKKLADQALEFHPDVVSIFDDDESEKLQKALAGTGIKVLSGKKGLIEISILPEAEMLVSALVGSIGLEPVLSAIHAGKNICLANKETLVVGGELVIEAAQKKNVKILPIDSEHSAIFQCLQNSEMKYVNKLILTASGGPFRSLSASEFSKITPKQALKHPNWEMGGKITIDSATLMNKGLEIIEARWLFDIGFDRIEVVIHPQSIIHSMVEFIDGSVLAQLGMPDMRLPIKYALSYPERLSGCSEKTDFLKLPPLTFEAPRIRDFPCLEYACEAGKRSGTMPCIVNAANEIAVEAFLNGKISFPAIPEIIRKCMNSLKIIDNPKLEELLTADSETRKLAEDIISRL
ncbi:MAG: 1-deoxy-D-xylulose-5-phosphate reductoisomerase [Candidatus Riflebacteria bacterium]|nr:1-deoxy-D-xylulose-5-phosphate reductoisomerase [Candidatus Riflebacteria bacterium]